MEEVINQKVKDFSKVTDIIQTILIFILALIVPAFLGNLIQVIFGEKSFIASHSQIIIGSIVNSCLVISALNLKGWKNILGVVTMPSISTILSGYVFNSASTIYMVCMIPAIWIGNFVLVYSIKYFMIMKNKNYFLAGIVGIIAKVLIIFIGFLIIKGIVNMPDLIAKNLQTAMSITQGLTATIGTIIAYLIYKAEIK